MCISTVISNCIVCDIDGEIPDAMLRLDQFVVWVESSLSELGGCLEDLEALAAFMSVRFRKQALMSQDFYATNPWQAG